MKTIINNKELVRTIPITDEMKAELLLGLDSPFNIFYNIVAKETGQKFELIDPSYVLVSDSTLGVLLELWRVWYRETIGNKIPDKLLDRITSSVNLDVGPATPVHSTISIKDDIIYILGDAYEKVV